ncbi:MAG: NUDIX hydrolase [Omnitrophica bacterium RIFCSPLOWO2_01_FULL_45_24]|nr:MAG: NUDIX hydrolase [Omnitrophica bacterium RIFCSPLOWO2_01_FULL_45_24]
MSYLAGHERQVTAAILEKDGNILIARRRKGRTLGGKWEFPGGKIEPGETPQGCLRRELKEEFDIETEVGDFFCSSKFKYGFIPIELLVYKVKYISGDFKVNEHDDAKWVNLHELNGYDFMAADKPVVRRLLSK